MASHILSVVGLCTYKDKVADEMSNYQFVYENIGQQNYINQNFVQGKKKVSVSSSIFSFECKHK